MARSTFEGPILAGDNRFGPLRNVGYAELVQDAYIDLSNTTAGTNGYSGSSGQFIFANGIPNVPGQLFTPSTSFPATTASPATDTSTQVYRGAVFYLPVGCSIQDVTVDYIAAITGESGATLTNVSVFVSNGVTLAAGTPAYATVALGTTTVGTAGRQTTTYSATNLLNMTATTTDIVVGNGQPALSQVVFTLSITGSASVAAPTGGKFNFTLRYTQPDNNIGTTTAYPYGNFD
jgi:hypothetical protein